jgi:radical SAM superfamily enzyme
LETLGKLTQRFQDACISTIKDEKIQSIKLNEIINNEKMNKTLKRSKVKTDLFETVFEKSFQKLKNVPPNTLLRRLAIAKRMRDRTNFPVLFYLAHKNQLMK